MVEINLLPKQHRKGDETNTWQYASIGLGLLTLLLIGIPELMIGGVINGKEKQLDDQNTQVTSLNQTVAPEFAKLNQQKTQLGLVNQTVQALTATKTSYWSTDLANFVNNMPSGSPISLTKLAMSDSSPSTLNSLPAKGKVLARNFDIEGKAGSTDAIINFLNAYEQNNYSVNFRSAQNNREQNNYTFSAAVQHYVPGSATDPKVVASGAAATGTAAASTPALPAAPTAPPATPGGKS